MPVQIDPSLGLPAKYTEWRDPQYAAVQAISNSDKPFFLADLPTGTGKSLLAIGVNRMEGNRAIYLCGTKQLQDQIMRDFGDIAVTLKGRNNYPCAYHYDRFPDVTAEDCRDPRGCKYINDCEYQQQKGAAMLAPLAVLNNAYFLNEVNGFNSAFAGRDMLIADEMDALDNALMNYIEFRITNRQIEHYHLTMPDEPDKKESWVKWMDGAIHQLGVQGATLKSSLFGDFQKWTKSQIETSRMKRNMEKLADRLMFLQDEIDESWIFYTSQKGNLREWVF
ncbi:MAG: hypothetical protein M0R20_06755, partial [Candidatus Omnitrophica bacterium]|nr:hypothetical protein [Candidatus Omnitrophota bacterium]